MKVPQRQKSAIDAAYISVLTERYKHSL